MVVKMVNMKTHNFIHKEQLSALLGNKITAVIEPAWEERITYYNSKTGQKLKTPEKYNMLTSKPHKVGDIFQFTWNKDSKYEWFCRECGEGMNKGYRCKCGALKPFNKNLCKVKATEDSRRIEIKRVNRMGYPEYFIYRDREPFVEWNEEYLADTSGYLSAEIMFKLLNKDHNLKLAKEFWITPVKPTEDD